MGEHKTYYTYGGQAINKDFDSLLGNRRQAMLKLIELKQQREPIKKKYDKAVDDLGKIDDQIAILEYNINEYHKALVHEHLPIKDEHLEAEVE